jgi:hypothetical protein
MKNLIESILSASFNHRKKIFAAFAILLLISLFAAIRSDYNNETSKMFPANSESGRTFSLLSDCHLAESVNVEFISAEKGKIAEYSDYLADAAGKIEKIKGVSRLKFVYRTASAADTVSSVTSVIPQLFEPQDILAECNPDKTAANAAKQLAMPVPGMIKILRNDIFSKNGATLQSFSSLQKLSGFEINQSLPFLADQSSTRALITFDGTIPPGNSAAVKQLLADIDAALTPLPAGLSYRVISGGLHSLSNEEILKKDASFSGVISTAAFLLIFFFRWCKQ